MKTDINVRDWWGSSPATIEVNLGHSADQLGAKNPYKQENIKRGTMPLDSPQIRNTAREEPKAEIVIVIRRSWWSVDQPRKTRPGADAPEISVSTIQNTYKVLY